MLAALLVYLFLLASPLYASYTLSAGSLPTEMEAGTAVEVPVAFAGDTTHYHQGDIAYLRGAFFELPSGTSYFGDTQTNSGEWLGSSSDKSRYFSFTLDESASWSGIIKVRVVPEDSGFKGTNLYGFKVGRYTSAGDSSADWTDVQTVKLWYNPPPTPTPLPSSNPTITPLPTPLTPYATPTPGPTPTPSPPSTPRPTPLPSIVPSPSTLSEAFSVGTVAGIMATSVPTATSSPSPLQVSTKPAATPWILLASSILIAGGAIPLGLKFFR